MSATALNVLKPNPVFGVDLTRLMQRDGQEVPAVVIKCAEAVEANGLKTVGLYRVSGTNTQIQRLKSSFDRSKLCVCIISICKCSCFVHFIRLCCCGLEFR